MEEEVHHQFQNDVVELPFLQEFDDVAVDAGDFPFNVDFDFTFDDISFADDLLLEQPEPNSDPIVLGSDVSDPNSDGLEVRVYNCEPISSEESNFRGKCDSPEIGSSKSNSGVFYSGDKVSRDKMESLDRISELPEFILHIILSFLDMKEACRASVLSKKWHAAWSSVPVLDFQPQYFKKAGSTDSGKYEGDFYDQNTLISYTEFINNTMERYSSQKHGIRKFCLEIPLFEGILKPSIDIWLGVAVQNKVEELDITIVVEKLSLDFILPEFLFSARSLKFLRGDKVVMPNYPTMKLFCLEKLILTRATIDDDMLQRIISNCPLIALEFRGCAALKSISVPYAKKSPKDDVAEDFGSGTPQSNNQTSTLEKFFYLDYSQCPWPWHMNIAALRNLTTVEITSADITDDVVFELASGLTVLEKLVLYKCILLKCVKISSISLRTFSVGGCHMLEKLTIDAPNLTMFQLYSELNFDPSSTNISTELPALSIVNVQDSCDGYLFRWVEFPCTEWFVELQEFLGRTNIFKVIAMTLSGLESYCQVGVDKDHLRKITTGAPYKVREIKLCDTCDWKLDESSISAILDGLFLSCRPDVLVIPTGFHNNTVETILIILKEKEQCWKDPLKSVEVEGFGSRRLLSYPYQVEIKLRLSW